jgi:hypothetical protein
MSFSSLANNQAVSYGNLQDAVNNGIFTLVSTIPSPTNRESTKSVVSASVSGFNPNYPPYAIKLSNQLIVKQDIYNPGDFILDAQYGIRFTSMTGSVGGLPTFTYPVTGGNTTKTYNGVIAAQTITVGLAGTLFVSPAKVVLYVNGVQVDCQNITSGVQTKTLNLSVSVGSPSTIKISINGGTCSSTPTTPIFTGKTFSTVSVNRGSGQYMVAGNAYLYGNPATTTGVTAGYLYYSSNYGSSWTQSSAYGFWIKIASSDNGQYVIAVEAFGKAYLSSNYGVSFTQISYFGTNRFNSAALSNDGQNQMIVGGVETSYVWVSTNYGVDWNIAASDIYGGYISCAIDSSGGTFLAGGGYGGSAFIIRSTNQGANWTYVLSGSNYGLNTSDININATNGWAIAAWIGTNPSNGILYKSSNSGTSWSQITGGSAQNAWIVSILNNTVSGLALYDLRTSNTSYIQSVTGAGPSFMNTVGNKLTSPSLTWRSLSNSDNGTYILAGENSGLYLSTDGGATFNAV